RQAHGIDFAFNGGVLGYDRPLVRTTAGEWQARQLVMCNGDDFQTLYPALFPADQFVRCKLQMMRSAPMDGGWRVGTMLAAGLTLRHYPSFAVCPSLSALVRRFDTALPEYGRFGIHVLVSQNGRGGAPLCDSHAYGGAIAP